MNSKTAKENPKPQQKSVKNGKVYGDALSAQEKKKIVMQKKKDKKAKKIAKSAQQTIPYIEMCRDGICKVNSRLYTKTIRFNDINYQLAQNEDKTAIFENWCDFLNYFDSSIFVQFSFINQRTSISEFKKAIHIPEQDDEFNDIRKEYSDMLQNQLTKGNNGLLKRKYITFGIEADSLRTAQSKLGRIEADILNNFKTLGVRTETLSGYERLKVLHDVFNMDSNEPFRFSFDMVARTGLSSKDFIAPTSFDFREGKCFKMGKTIGAVSFLQILAPELNDRMLADFLDMDSNITVNFHIRTLDQAKAIKSIKSKITDLDKMKIEEQKKAVRSGYDMDIIPSDLATFGGEAKRLLQDLQTRNERMFLVTILLMNTAPTRQKLENAVFQTASIAQKYNCALKRLDFQQEEALMSSLPIGLNQIEIERGLTTSSTAVFIPFVSQELFQDGQALYYGLNALSNNMIMVDRKQLKNPNGLILGTPGCFAGETRVRLADGRARSLSELVDSGVEEIEVKAYDMKNEEVVNAKADEIRIEKYVKDLLKIGLSDGTSIRCTKYHSILNGAGDYLAAEEITVGTILSGNLEVVSIEEETYPEYIPVYDLTVFEHMNYILENGLIVHNSGKSFSAKREMTNAFLITEDDIIVCDPEAEYFPLVQKLGGQVIRVSPVSSDYINPMDINLNYSEEENPLTLKSDFILSMCELIVGGKEGLQPVEKTIIHRSVRMVYQDYLADPVPEKMPILEDLYNILREQKEPEAQRIATALEIYVHGSLNVFNHRTNVDVNNRFVCYDIKQLGKQLKKLGMLIVQDQVWNRVTVNRAQRKATRYYMDEFHLLLKEEQTAAYSVEIWKRFRKWGGIPTGITQNVKDLLASREVENIFENSDFVYLLNQASGDRKILSAALNISPSQQNYVTNSNAGEGLIFYGSTIVPFKDDFPKDTQLYRIMTTKPEEAEQN